MARCASIILISGFVLCSTVISFNNETVDFTNEVRAVILGIMTLALFILLASRADPADLTVLKNPIFAVFLFYWLTVTFSISVADNFGEAITSSLVIFMRIVLLFAATIVLKDQKWFSKAVIIVTIGLGIFSAYQIIFTPAVQPTGLMGNKNQCASAFFLLSVLCLHYWRSWKVPATIALSLSGFAIVFLRARSVWLAVLVAALVFVITNRKYALCALVLIPMACGITWGIKGNTIFEASSLEQRFDIWKQTARMIKDHPMGVGAGNWQVKFPVYSGFLQPSNRRLTYEDDKFITHAYNEPLQICSEVGYIGVVSYLLLFALAIYYSSGWPRAGLAGFMALSLFTFSGERPFHSMMVIFLFALAIIQFRKRHWLVKPVKKWPATLSVLVAGVLIFAVYVFAVRYETSRQLMRIYQARTDSQWKTMIAETQRISPFSTIDNNSTTPIRFYRGIAWFAMGEGALARGSFAIAQKDNPNHLYSVMNMAYSYVLAGELDLADMYYQKAKKMYPDFKDIDRALHAMDTLTGRLIGEGI